MTRLVLVFVLVVVLGRIVFMHDSDNLSFKHERRHHLGKYPCRAVYENLLRRFRTLPQLVQAG